MTFSAFNAAFFQSTARMKNSGSHPYARAFEPDVMTKSDEMKFPADGAERLRAVHAADTGGPRRPASPKSKKERPASKGRVHKGRTRN